MWPNTVYYPLGSRGSPTKLRLRFHRTLYSPKDRFLKELLRGVPFVWVLSFLYLIDFKFWPPYDTNFSMSYSPKERFLKEPHRAVFFFPRDIFFRARDNFRKNARDIEKTAVTIFDQKKWPWHFFECPWQKSQNMPVTRFLRPWHFSKSARDTKNHARDIFCQFFLSLQLEIWFLSKYFKCK